MMKTEEAREEAVPLLLEEENKKNHAEDENGVILEENTSNHQEGTQEATTLKNQENETNTQNPRNEEPPPSYESLFGKMKNCGEETANAFGFMRTSTSILLENDKCTFCTLILMAIPITAIVLGVIHKEHCTKQPFIPIYLIVIGASHIFQQLVRHLYKKCSNEEDRGRNVTCSCCECLISVMSLFSLGWFIAGNYWIYSAFEPNYHDTSHADYCHKDLYLFAFWMTTAVYILIGFLCCCTCFVAFCSACCLVFAKE